MQEIFKLHIAVDWVLTEVTKQGVNATTNQIAKAVPQAFATSSKEYFNCIMEAYYDELREQDTQVISKFTKYVLYPTRSLIITYWNIPSQLGGLLIESLACFQIPSLLKLIG